MQSVAVYCSSSNLINDVYKQAATALGEALAKNDITLVFGGSINGLMGIVADATMAAGGKAIGVMPNILKQHEITHHHLTELIEVTTMHERKKMMMERAEGFIVMPGGAGTMEEFFEVFTWSQIGLVSHPIAILNVNGYYDHLLALLNQMTTEKFLQPQFSSALIVESDVETLLEKMRTFEKPQLKTF